MCAGSGVKVSPVWWGLSHLDEKSANRTLACKGPQMGFLEATQFKKLRLGSRYSSFAPLRCYPKESFLSTPQPSVRVQPELAAEQLLLPSSPAPRCLRKMKRPRGRKPGNRTLGCPAYVCCCRGLKQRTPPSDSNN